MAAIPSFGFGADGINRMSFATNELGTQQFFRM